MLRNSIWRSLVVGSFVFGAIFMLQASAVRAADADPKARPVRNPAQEHWESVVLFYGDEETGEWSLRIRDQDVRERGWFEYLELWQFDRGEKRWVQVKVDKFAKPIVLPKQKGQDEPKDNQTLVEFKEIEPRTAGLWWAKWKVDNVECATLMRVGTGKSANKITEKAGPGMIPMVVPIDLNKSEQMLIPDPRTYCVVGGAGKPEK